MSDEVCKIIGYFVWTSFMAVFESEFIYLHEVGHALVMHSLRPEETVIVVTRKRSLLARLAGSLGCGGKWLNLIEGGMMQKPMASFGRMVGLSEMEIRMIALPGCFEENLRCLLAVMPVRGLISVIFPVPPILPTVVASVFVMNAVRLANPKSDARYLAFPKEFQKVQN